MGLPIATAQDNFDDSVKSGIWGNPSEAATATVSETAGNMVVTADNATAGINYGEYYSKTAYDLTNGATYINIDVMFNTATNAQAYFKLVKDANNNVQWVQQNGTIKVQKTVAGVTSDVGSNTYDYGTYRWLQIRESGGTLYFYYTYDGHAWQMFTSLVNPFAVTDLFVVLGGGTFQSETNPGVLTFDNFNIRATTRDNPKTYVYQSYQHNDFMGVIQNVVNDFSYSHMINTAYCQLDIEVGATPDTADQTVEAILTEEGIAITDESSNNILIERQPDLVGGENENAVIANNNDIRVWEYSQNYPAGLLVFSGYISKWKAKFGTDGDSVFATVLSYGAELNNYLIEGTFTADQTQATQDANTTIYDKEPGALFSRIHQSFVAGVGITNIAAVTAYLSASSGADVGRYVVCAIYTNQPDAAAYNGNYICAVARPLTSTTAGEVTFTFPSPGNVVAGNTYYIVLAMFGDESTPTAKLYYKTGDPYASGECWRLVYNAGSYVWANLGGDIYFKTWWSNNGTALAYSSQDPGTVMRSVIDSYRNRGGTIYYNNDTIATVGTTISYTFKVNTVLEGLQKILELSPATYYWYVDPATSILYFKLTLTTATHKLIKGRHLSSVELEATIENLVNIVYFSGGATAGVNLFQKYTNTSSLRSFRPGLAKLSDNRVTDTTTGTLLAFNLSDEHDGEEYITNIEVLETAYDISLFNVGDTVGFAGFGTFMDGFVLQIVSMKRMPDKVQLGLGMLPFRPTQMLQELLARMNDIDTVANPSVPS